MLSGEGGQRLDRGSVTQPVAFANLCRTRWDGTPHHRIRTAVAAGLAESAFARQAPIQRASQQLAGDRIADIEQTADGDRLDEHGDRVCATAVSGAVIFAMDIMNESNVLVVHETNHSIRPRNAQSCADWRSRFGTLTTMDAFAQYSRVTTV